MKNLFLLNRSGMSPEVTCRKGRHAIESIVSRISLASLICLCMLTLGVGNVRGGQYTYNFADATKWYTTSAKTTNVSTGNTNNYDTFYDTNGVAWTASGASRYFSGTYFLLGKTSAYVVLPTYSGEKITSVVLHGSTGHSTSVSVNIYTTGGTAASSAQTWSTKNVDHTYNIGSDYQASTLRIQVTNNYNTQFTSVTINTEPTGGGGSCNAIDVTGGSAVILPAGSTTVSSNDWKNAGAPTAYNTAAEYSIGSGTKYCVTLTQAGDYGNSNGLQLKASAGIVSVTGITSNSGVDVEILISSGSGFSIALTGATTLTDQSSGTKTISTTSTSADLTISKTSSGAGYIKYIKVTPKAAPSKTLSSIAITTAPTTTKYIVGDTFDKTGAVVTATYSDATTANVSTSATWTPTGALTAGTGKTVTASYTEGGVTKTATTTIDVYSVTVQKKDEDGTTISDAGVSASATGRTLTASAGSTNYVFKTWKYGTASGTSIASATSASTSLTGTPSAAVTVIAEFYKPITVTWMNNGTQHTTNTAARGSKPIFPSTPSACDGTSTTFIGWTQTPWDGKIAQSAVDAKTTDATKVCTSPSSMPDVTAAVTYHAVFAKGGSYSKITTSGDFTSGKYLVVNTAAEKAMQATIYSDKYLTATSVTISGTSISSAADNLIWQVSKNSSIYTFYNASAGKYAEIVADGSYGKMSLESSSQGYTAAVDGSGNWTLSSQNIDGQLIRYNNTYVEFQAYNATDANKVIQLYKQAFSDYLTTCCTPHTIAKAGSPAGTVTGGTFTTSEASACEGVEVTLNATPSSSAYKFGGWTITNGSSTDITTTVLGDGHAGDNPATMTMPNEAVTVNATFVSLSSIAVQTPPTKTAYLEGETFDPTGLVITRTYSNSTSDTYTYAGHEAEFTFSPTTATALTTSDAAVSITYGGQSVNQSINVYSVTVQAKDENDDAIAAGGPGSPTFTVATRGITPAADAANYKFWKWTISGAELGSAATTKTNTITNPTGNVTVTAVYYLPRTVTWLVNGEEWKPYTDAGSGTDGTAVVTKGVAWSTLTLPTDPTTSDGCGDKFVGWVATPISGKQADDTGLDLMTSANKSDKTGAGHNVNDNITFHAVFADYVE